MATMPLSSTNGQPDSASAWFGSEAGQALLESEHPAILRAFAERPAQPWLWLGPVVQTLEIDSRGLRLVTSDGTWAGAVHCGLPLPLANESVGVVVVQHAAKAKASGSGLLDECARVLAPGGRLWLFALNPLAPYRWRWRGSGFNASEPLTWRRRLRAAGLAPEPVSQGIGPSWQPSVAPDLQNGPGLRAAYILRAEKRAWPLTPVRQRPPLRLPEGVPAA
jgi:SAM-dependent methyltransferase